MGGNFKLIGLGTMQGFYGIYTILYTLKSGKAEGVSKCINPA